ncbi:hypothetical protein EGW08_009381 [Elysia chlorotica]|uniref:Uncharacterized protein n=1 Tax=Elysia chlorotica TaxID=188477 RepID=A0A433TMQ5_ELYCH|nr:hypothetical protein EGW08_009381 [Elysia chlorotica]
MAGVKKSLVLNVIYYAKQLPRPGSPDYIDELIFTAQMAARFGITSKFHIQLIFGGMVSMSKFHIQLIFGAVREKTSKFVKLENFVKLVCIFYTKNLALKVDFVNERFRSNCKNPRLASTRDYVRNDILYIQMLGQVLPLEHVMEE